MEGYIYRYLYSYLYLTHFACTSAEDAAARIIRLAQAMQKECPGILSGVKIISALDLAKGESRLHGLARRWKLTLPLDIYLFNRTLLFQPMVRVPTWMEYILRCKPGILLGGFDLHHDSLPNFLKCFWEAFRREQPTHQVFETHGSDLGHCVPYMLFGDEGRSLRKCPIQIMAVETVFGQGTYERFCQLHKSGEHMTEDLLLDCMMHTGKGTSLKTRLLLYALPHGLYKSKLRKGFWHACLEQVTEGCIEVFHSGISCGSAGKFYGICIGCKGDAPFLAKAGKLKRTFMSVGGHLKGICPQCLAGTGRGSKYTRFYTSFYIEYI